MAARNNGPCFDRTHVRMFNSLPAYISILCNTVYSALQFRTYQSIYQQHVLVVIRLFRSSGPSK